MHKCRAELSGSYPHIESRFLYSKGRHKKKVPGRFDWAIQDKWRVFNTAVKQFWRSEKYCCAKDHSLIPGTKYSHYQNQVQLWSLWVPTSVALDTLWTLVNIMRWHNLPPELQCISNLHLHILKLNFQPDW